jgi:hypothetical protein
MVPIYIIVKANGDVWLTLSKADATAVGANVARVELTPNVHPGGAKVAAIGGSAGAYTFTVNAASAEFGNIPLRSF